MVRFEVKGKVIPKGRPRFTKRGHTYTPAKTRAYEKLVKQTALMNIKEPFKEAVTVAIQIFKTPPKSWSKKKKAQALSGVLLPVVKPDIDNYAKGILDALNGVVYEDDNQIIKLIVEKQYGDEDKAIIEIETCQ